MKIIKHLKITSISFFCLICFFSGVYFYSHSGAISIPVIITPTNKPLIEVEIESTLYFLLLDLGYSSLPMTLDQELLEKIHKTPHGKIKTSDFRGNIYENLLNLLPKIKIKNLSFFEVITGEYYDDFKKNTVIWTDQEALPSPKCSGVVGSRILQRENLLLDFPNSKIMFCRNLNQLKKMGYFRKNPLQVPIKKQDNLIYLEIQTDLGTQLFLLDTGSSISAIKASLIKNHEAPLDSYNCPIFITSQFSIGERDFGSTSLHSIEIASLFNCDGILGMPFFKNHSIYFNFQEKTAYID